MKTEQMPERIAILTPPGMTEADYSLFWVTPPCLGGEHVVKDTGHDYAEYVRADLAQGNPDEPLADGQWRWAKFYLDGEWEIVRVVVGENLSVTILDSSARKWDVCDYDFMGIVITPPSDTHETTINNQG